MNNPLVSVLMSVYNGADFLGEAIESILKQTFYDFEFIIVNDGSTDSSGQIIADCDDKRIRKLDNTANLGLAASLNRGILEARGEYIARMDADDISLPERLEKQLFFMQTHDRISVCGTWIKYIGDENMVIQFPPDDATIRCKLLFENNIAHPSVILRKEHFLKHSLFYNPACTSAQDYDLWQRGSRYLSYANLNEILLLYRLHSKQTGKTDFNNQQKITGLVRLNELKNLGINATPDEIALHEAITWHQFNYKQTIPAKTHQWFVKLKSANNKTNYYPEPQFSNMLENKLQVIREICEV